MRLALRTLGLTAITTVVFASCTTGSGGDTNVGSIRTPSPQGGGVAATSAPDDGGSATQAPATGFETIKFSGKGDKVVKFSIPEDAAAIATFTAKGSSNFVVESLASDGSTNDLLVNVIGAYKGTVLFDASFGTHSVAFKIQASSTWTVAIRPISAARVWSFGSKLTGAGDDVVAIDPPIAGLQTASFTHSGFENFIVEALGPDNTDVLINEIGKYNGQVQIPDGTILLSVNADGSWTATPD